MVLLKKFFALFILVFLLIGCARNDPNQNEHITIEIKEGTLSNKGATVVLTNVSDETVIITSYFLIEKKNNGNWEEVPYVIDESIVAWEDIAYPVGGEYEEVIELTIDWDWLYGTLDEGVYRLSKDYFLNDDISKEEIISVNFVIE